MATATANLAPSSVTDAEFRAWGSAIGSKLAAFGWVQTADTGQIDWGTVTRPTTSALAGVKGYEIWRMNDALHATQPVYMKLEYGGGVGGIAVQNPAIGITVGFGTDGAGAITGTQKTTRTMIGARAGPSSTTFECEFSGDTNRFQMGMWPSSAANGVMWLSVERTKDSSWNDTASGVIVCGGLGTTATSHYSQPILTAGGVATAETHLPGTVSENTSSARGTTVGFGFHAPLHGEALHPGLGVILYARDDATLGTTFALTVGGTSRTYYPLGNNLTNVGQPANSRVAIRYE